MIISQQRTCSLTLKWQFSLLKENNKEISGFFSEAKTCPPRDCGVKVNFLACLTFVSRIGLGILTSTDQV